MLPVNQNLKLKLLGRCNKKTHFPIYNDKLEPVCALQTTLLSAQQAGTLTTYPGDVAPRTTPCLWLLGQRHEAVEMLSLPGTAG